MDRQDGEHRRKAGLRSTSRAGESDGQECRGLRWADGTPEKLKCKAREGQHRLHDTGPEPECGLQLQRLFGDEGR